MKKERKEKRLRKKKSEVGRFHEKGAIPDVEAIKKSKENGNDGGPLCLFLPLFVIATQSPLTDDPPPPTVCSWRGAVSPFC